MVRVAGNEEAARSVKRSILRLGLILAAVLGGGFFLYQSSFARVGPDEFGVEQVRFGSQRGIRDSTLLAGLYFVPPGTTMHNFPRSIHVLEATEDQEEARRRAKGAERLDAVDKYYARRARLLGPATHRVVDALNVQTSDGYAVTADVTLLYSIADPVMVARSFGWGTAYVDAFAINTFRNGVLANLGKMNAESFYNEAIRIAAVAEAESFLKERFRERGFQVEKLLLRNYRYAENYEKSLHDKKVAVQLAEKNKKERLVNEEKARLQQLDSQGNATITIAESEIRAQIAKTRAEAELYSSQVRARGDTEVNIAAAEAKRLKADALNTQGGRYVVALETARMFDNIEGAVMSPDQYIQFIRSAWALIGVSPGAAAPPAAGRAVQP